MNQKNNLVWIVIIVLIAFASFYGGITYNKSKGVAAILATRSNRPAGQFGGQNTGNRNGGGFTAGEILSMDTQSITIKLQNGGSKIIFYTNKTPVSKMVDGTSADLVTGNQITVMGSTNPDGSINAESVQIRPTSIKPN